MAFLLDTNVCIALLKGDEKAKASLLATPPADVVVCSVVVGELQFGARKSAQVERNLARLEAFLGPLVSLPFDDSAALHYGIVRATLEREGRPIGGNDLMIASVALAHDATVVTRNSDEFSRVPGLRRATW